MLLRIPQLEKMLSGTTQLINYFEYPIFWLFFYFTIKFLNIIFYNLIKVNFKNKKNKNNTIVYINFNLQLINVKRVWKCNCDYFLKCFSLRNVLK
jgi:hypothetical protein